MNFFKHERLHSCFHLKKQWLNPLPLYNFEGKKIVGQKIARMSWQPTTWKICHSDTSTSCEPWKKPSYFSLYWLVHRGHYIGLLQSPSKWSIILYIKQSATVLNTGRFFFPVFLWIISYICLTHPAAEGFCHLETIWVNSDLSGKIGGHLITPEFPLLKHVNPIFRS